MRKSRFVFTAAATLAHFVMLLAGSAWAQSVPNPSSPIAMGNVWTPAQWITAFEAKVDVTNGTLTNPAITGGTIAGAALSNPTLSGTVNTTGVAGYEINGFNAINVLDGNFNSGNGNGWGPACLNNCATIAGALAGGNLASTERLATLYGFNAGGHMNSTAGNGTEAAIFGWNSGGALTGTSSYVVSLFGTNLLGVCTTGCHNITALGSDGFRDSISATNSIVITTGQGGDYANGDSNIFIGGNDGLGNSGNGFTGGLNTIGGFGTFQAAGGTSLTVKNTMWGASEANGCTTCNNLTLSGYSAGGSIVTESGSAFFGAFSGQDEIGGTQNSGLGQFSCGQSTNTTQQTCVGYAAGFKMTGNNSTSIGAGVGNATNGSSGTGDLLIGVNNTCDTPNSSISNYIGICGSNGVVFSVTGTGTPATSVTTIAGTLTSGIITSAQHTNGSSPTQLGSATSDVVLGSGTQLSALNVTVGFAHLPYTNATSGSGGIPTGTPATVDGDGCEWNDVSFTINCFSASANAWKHVTLSANAG